MNKMFLHFLFFAGLIVAFSACNLAETPLEPEYTPGSRNIAGTANVFDDVEYELVADYWICSSVELSEEIIRNGAQFDQVWDDVVIGCTLPNNLPEGPPYVDFSQYVVIGWTYYKPNSCWGGEYLKSAEYLEGSQIYAVLEQYTPGEGCLCLPVAKKGVVFYTVKKPVGLITWEHIQTQAPPCN